jgi:hypothetical protein
MAQVFDPLKRLPLLLVHGMVHLMGCVDGLVAVLSRQHASAEAFSCVLLALTRLKHHTQVRPRNREGLEADDRGGGANPEAASRLQERFRRWFMKQPRKP